MRSPFLLLIGVFLLTGILYAATQDQLFGTHPKAISDSTANAAATETGSHSPNDGHDHSGEQVNSAGAITIDTILYHAREGLSPAQVKTVDALTAAAGSSEDKIHAYHGLARYWGDTLRLFEPHAWYTAEAARLENTEKSLTFAAHKFLDNLRSEEHQALKRWKGEQAKDLYTRSLQLNPANDSAQIGLGATLLLAGLGATPMEGIGMIRKVVEKDSTNVFAQMTLGQASVLSGQLDKALDRFQKVVRLQPRNLEANLALADAYDRLGKKAEAVQWYRQSMAVSGNKALNGELQKRITELSK